MFNSIYEFLDWEKPYTLSESKRSSLPSMSKLFASEYMDRYNWSNKKQLQSNTRCLYPEPSFSVNKSLFVGAVSGKNQYKYRRCVLLCTPYHTIINYYNRRLRGIV